jgi:enoyl-CoA hydratase/carnithine racemase
MIVTAGLPDFTTIRFRRESSVAWITLDRPEALNSIDDAMIGELELVLDHLEHEPGLTALVLHGEGKAFCAGADLKAARGRAAVDDAAAATAVFLRRVGRTIERIATFPAPTVAAVGGLALAGGLELALGCDLIVATRSSRFGDAHANYGLLPGGGASVRLPRRLGVSRAKLLMFTGDFVTAEVMKEWGLVVALAEDESLVQEVRGLVERISTKSPLGLRRIKALVDHGMEMPNGQALEFEQQMCLLHSYSEDRREGLAAFAEKRAPRFVGR